MSTYPPITAGTALTSVLLKAMLGQSAIKGSSQSVTSSTTLVNDAALVLALPANSTWKFTLDLLYQANTTANLKFGWTVPSGCTLAAGVNFADTTLVARLGQMNQSTVQPVGGNGATTPLSALVSGTIVVSSTAGNLQLQWAQNTSNATAASVLAGSDLTATRFA